MCRVMMQSAVFLRLTMVSLITLSGLFAGCIHAAEQREYVVQGFLSVEDGAVTSSRQPEILFVFEGDTPLGTTVRFVLDGSDVDTVYDKTLRMARYQPGRPLAPGVHIIKCLFLVNGQQGGEFTSRFTVVEGAQPPLPSANDEQIAVAAVNVVRVQLGLPVLEPDLRLVASAQNHSNYAYKNQEFSHSETAGKPGYTGTALRQRTDFSGFFGFLVAETGTEESGSLQAGIDRLKDAPYHRLDFVNPGLRSVGVGFNVDRGEGTGNIFINYGADRPTGDDDRVILYPFPGQVDVKVGWRDIEWPDPLRFFGKTATYVGYPISISIHDRQTAELRAQRVELSDNKGQVIPFYLVDANTETDANNKRHIFVIPAAVLQPGMSYEVSVQAVRVLKNGAQIPFAKKWTFTAGGNLTVRYGEFAYISGREFIRVYAENGDLADLSYVIMQQDTAVRAFAKGEFYDMNGRPLVPGVYRLEVHSDLFGQTKVYELQIAGQPEARKVSIHETGGAPLTDFAKPFFN